MENNEEYEPYGEEWVKEMKKFPKEALIGMLKVAYMQLAESINSINYDE